MIQLPATILESVKRAVVEPSLTKTLPFHSIKYPIASTSCLRVVTIAALHSNQFLHSVVNLLADYAYCLDRLSFGSANQLLSIPGRVGSASCCTGRSLKLPTLWLSRKDHGRLHGTRHEEGISISVPCGRDLEFYGQLFTRFVTFGLPNPVAKSQPF